jgi:hypothetical protein
MPAINARFDLRGRVMAITGGDRQGVWATAAVGGYEACLARGTHNEELCGSRARLRRPDLIRTDEIGLPRFQPVKADSTP